MYIALYLYPLGIAMELGAVLSGLFMRIIIMPHIHETDPAACYSSHDH